MSIAADRWDLEYRVGGIPSSVRDEASTTLIWALTNWPLIAQTPAPQFALDVGCGTGRNALYLASQGVGVVAFDFSAEAIAIARQRQSAFGQPLSLEFMNHDLSDGLPVGPQSVDFVSDIFVYKHQMDADARQRYRTQVATILRPNGKLLLSLAEIRDGYYAACPLYVGDRVDDPLSVIDPQIQAGSILFSLTSLINEFHDTFELVMSWLKVKDGLMHGSIYQRYTLATIWEVRS